MNPPDDIVSAFLERGGAVEGGGFFYELKRNPDAHAAPCRVYWGSHGCERPRGHDGPHWCDCCECDDHPGPACVAGPPYYGPETLFFGEDA